MKALLVGCLTFVIAGSSGCGPLPSESDSTHLVQEEGQHPWNLSGKGTVTDVYGLAKIREGTTYAESKVKPWSSYWFPNRDTSLYAPIESEPAPLQKFDQWTLKAKKLTTKAAEHEKNFSENGRYDDSWAGLCNAWSKASIFEQEPTRPVEVDGVKFNVFDLKALLIKSYENTEGFKNYGERYNGRRGDNFDDIYADQFHRFLQAELFEKGKPFIMDRDPGIQVWNVPVFKAEVTINKDSGNPNVMHVHTTLGAAGTRDDLNFVGTWQVSYEYYYDLFGVTLPDGGFEVRSGVWTGSSMDNHPDFVTAIPEKTIRFSDNPELKTVLVDEILSKARKANSLFDFLF